MASATICGKSGVYYPVMTSLAFVIGTASKVYMYNLL